jgi:hypothetical protein
MQHMQLSTQAQNELAAYKRTNELDTTGHLYNDVYEYVANDMCESTRQDEELQYDYVMGCINKL